MGEERKALGMERALNLKAGTRTAGLPLASLSSCCSPVGGLMRRTAFRRHRAFSV